MLQYLIAYLILFLTALFQLVLFPIHLVRFLYEQIRLFKYENHAKTSRRLFLERYGIVKDMFLGNLVDVQIKTTKWAEEKIELNKIIRNM